MGRRKLLFTKNNFQSVIQPTLSSITILYIDPPKPTNIKKRLIIFGN